MKSYDHLNFSTDFVVQFWVSRYVRRLNGTSEWKVMNICISRELPLFNFDRLYKLCALIWHPSEKLWPFEFSRASVVQFWASWYIMRLNRTSEWNDMTIWISRELPLINFERLDILCAWIGHPSETLWQFEFSRASVVQFRVSRYLMRLNRISEWEVMTI